MVFTFIKHIYNSVFSNNIIEKKNEIVYDKYTEPIPKLEYKQKKQIQSSFSDNICLETVYNYWIY